MLLALLPGLVLLAMGCASPIQELWPPAPDSPTRDIIVSVDTWHAVIAFPQDGNEQPSRSFPLASSPVPRAVQYEEWGYAEQAWYLEGRRGFTGVLRALFWPSAGVVEVGTHARPWSERTPDPPAEQFQFRLSDEGFLRLRTFLESSRASETTLLSADGRSFYPARGSYSVFHHCHHFAAHALRAAGLPVFAAWALTRTLFVAQLHRAERMADRESGNEETLVSHREVNSR